MEGDQGYNKFTNSSSAGIFTSAGGSPSKLPLRRLTPRGSMPPPPAKAATNNHNASSSRGKGKVVVDSGKNSSNNNSGKNGGTGGSHAQGEVAGAGAGAGAGAEQDMSMPIANVIRLMRQVLPQHAKIAEDAKETIQECVSEYISFVTSEANERCRQEQRKTITAEDLLWAMSKLGFDDYIAPLTVYLHRYRELEGDNRGSLRGTLRGDSLPPIKRSASDAGLFMQQQPPQHPVPPAQGHYHNLVAANIPQYTYVQQPPAYFPGAASGSAPGGRGLLQPPTQMPLNYYRPEAPAYRDIPPTGYVNVPGYREIAPAPAPALAYGDVAGYRDMGVASSSSHAAGPSQLPPFPEFDPFAPYQ